MAQAWLVDLQVDPLARVRLICFPHAGGSAFTYHGWKLPPEFELSAVQLPGRGPRHKEAACTSVAAACEAVIKALRPTIDAGTAFAFFGHSFGALLAAEVARALTERSLRTPIAVFVSAHAAPTVALAPAQARLSQVATDSALLHALEQWDFVGAEALGAGAGEGGAELRALALPPIRSDLSMREQLCATAASAATAGTPVTPLPCPVHAFGGLSDRSCAEADLQSWRSLAAQVRVPSSSTSSTDCVDAAVGSGAGVDAERRFTCTLLPGGHFYPEEAEGRMPRSLNPGVAEIRAMLVSRSSPCMDRRCAPITPRRSHQRCARRDATFGGGGAAASAHRRPHVRARDDRGARGGAAARCRHHRRARLALVRASVTRGERGSCL